MKLLEVMLAGSDRLRPHLHREIETEVKNLLAHPDANRGLLAIARRCRYGSFLWPPRG